MTADFLEHYGVKGMKHGVRNGPPYPLKGEGKANFLKQAKKKISKVLSKASKKQKKKAEKAKQESDEEIRQKVLKSVDPKYIYKHRALLDDKELQGRIDRINKETTLKKMAEPSDKAYNIAKKGDNWLKTSASMAKSLSEIYTAANVIKSISEKGVNKSEKSTVNINIGGKNNKKKNKDKDKKKDDD